MYALHGQGMPVLAPIDQDAAVHAVMLDSHISGSLYEAMGVDTKKLKQAIRREISTGISTGASYDDIARNLRFATNAPLAGQRPSSAQRDTGCSRLLPLMRGMKRRSRAATC